MVNRFMPRWTIANTLGWGVGLSLGLILMFDNRLWAWAPTTAIGLSLALLAGGVATGLGVGATQWIAWRNPASRLASWLASSTAGGALVYFVTWFTFPLLRTVDFDMGFVVPLLGVWPDFSLGHVLGGPLTGLLVGLLMGLAQSTSLNKQMSSLRWIGISTLAGALGFLVGNLVSWMIPSLFICASITGLVYGIVSGMLLSGWTPARWVLSRPDGSAGDAMDDRSNAR